MAKRQDITARTDNPWFINTNKILLIEILQEGEGTPRTSRARPSSGSRGSTPRTRTRR
jgi:hypothetical protein